MREHILSEIRRITQTAGKAPGRVLFESETGIRPSAWLGIYWARWGDALQEAGVPLNQMQGNFDRNLILTCLAMAVRHHARVPTYAEIRMFTRTSPVFPAHSTISRHFPSRNAIISALKDWIEEYPDYADIATFLPAISETSNIPASSFRAAEGYVYLLKSGGHYKIGRSDDIERRIKEIRIALPDKAELVHTIRTDDPAGIEAYWHRRFANDRANGEWFKLSAIDVAAFRKRKFQ